MYKHTAKLNSIIWNQVQSNLATGTKDNNIDVRVLWSTKQGNTSWRQQDIMWGVNFRAFLEILINIIRNLNNLYCRVIFEKTIMFVWIMLACNDYTNQKVI